MKKKTLLAGVALFTAGALALAGCAGDDNPSAGGATLVIDATFDAFNTTDPAQERSSMGALSVKAMYESLITFDGGDLSQTVPGLATMTVNDAYTEFTFKLDTTRKFVSGATVTVEDAVYTLERARSLNTLNSPYLANLTFTKTDDTTLTITSPTPRPELPGILGSSWAGIVEKKVVEENGGTMGESDTADQWFNTATAGTGPYTIERADFSSELVLKRNPNYNGSKPAGYDRVILRKADASTQKMSLEAGDAQMVLDISPAEAATLDPSMVLSTPSLSSIYLLTNFKFFGYEGLKGLRAAIDYDALIEQAGAGARQLNAIIPFQFAGAASESVRLKRDLAVAEPIASAFAETIHLSYLSDATIYGLQFTSLAEKLQAQLQEAGFKVELKPTPGSVFWADYMAGAIEVGLAYWLPEYLDPAGYLVFAPKNEWAEENVFGDTYANWTEASAEFTKTIGECYTLVEPSARNAAFAKWGALSNQESAYVPLFQPAINIGHAADVDGIVYNGMWTVDVGMLKPKS
ncbi:MAG: ABC transporter substrate-binding protein [Propionibacteriaceae bacterium]|jgi:peptide/nickel transport system substrate-binding protein|nr:ABC transporter substrate-binding protein [Propionibacteriaceae bacterium]